MVLCTLHSRHSLKQLSLFNNLQIIRKMSCDNRFLAREGFEMIFVFRFFVLLVLSCTVFGCGGSETSGNLDNGTGVIAGTLTRSGASNNTAKTLAAVANTTPLAGVKVTVENNSSLSATTDSAGSFTIKDVPAGTYTIVADTTDSTGTHLAVRRTDVTVIAGNSSKLGILSMSIPATLKGVAGLRNRTDMSGIRIDIPGTMYVTYTDFNGAFELGVPAGTYTFRAHKIGYNDYLYNNVQAFTGVTTTLTAQTLSEIPGSVSVTGTATIYRGASVDHLEAMLMPKTPNSDRDVYKVPINNGTFSIDAVTPGVYRLYVGDRVDSASAGFPGTRDGEVSTYECDITVGNRDITLPNITLRPGATGTFLGVDASYTLPYRGFNFDTESFNANQASNDLFLVNVGTSVNPNYQLRSNGNNLVLIASGAAISDFKNLKQVPATGFVSSLPVNMSDLLVVRTSAGNYAKVIISGIGFYGGTSPDYYGCVLTIRWQLQPDGALLFDY